MSYIERLEEFYEYEGEEELRLKKDGEHYLEYLTATKYMDRFVPPGSRVLDSCAGSGVYSFYLAGEGHTVTAGDIVARNVALMNEKQAVNPSLESIYQGDARDLSRFGDESFDAVLCMGAIYHLPAPGDRELAVRESLRVLRRGGIFICSYMNRYAVILGNCMGSLENIDEILRYEREGLEGVFYASTPKEIETLTESCGIKRLCHLSLDGISNFLYSTAGTINKKGLERWRRYHFATCENRDLLGYGYHNLYIGAKP